MVDNMLLFQRAAAVYYFDPFQVEGFLRVWNNFRVDLYNGALPLITHASTIEKHVRVIRNGRMGFVAASGNVDWDDLLKVAKEVAVYGPTRDEDFLVEDLTGHRRVSTGSNTEDLLILRAQDIVDRIQQDVGNAHIQVTVEHSQAYVVVANRKMIASKMENRVECGVVVLMSDGQPLAVVKRDVVGQDEDGWGLVLESALNQIGCDCHYVEFDDAVNVCLLSGHLYPSLVRRYLAFAFDPERLGADGAGFSINPNPCLHLIHDPACTGKTLDDEGQVPVGSDIFHDGLIYVPVRRYSKRAWLGEPVPDLGGIRVAPGHEGRTSIDQGVAICELAELGYNSYEGTCSALVTEGYLIVGGQPAGRLRPNLGVVIDIRALIERTLAVWPGPVEQTDEGSSPPVLVHGSSINWC